MTIRNSLITILLILTCLISVFGQAQSQYDKGTPPQLAAGVSSLGSYVSTELGTVNLSNGGLNFNIPLGTIGGRGNVALPLTLSYSSKIWSASMDVDIEQASWTEQSVAYADYDMGSSLGGGPLVPGWTLGTGMYLSSNFVRIKRIMSGPNAGCHTYGLTKLSLHLPDKGEIEFRDDATDGAPLLLNCGTQQTASRGTRWSATDGSGAIFINDVENGASLFPFPNLSGTIIFADGTRLGSTTNGAIVDRHGNKISPTANGYLDQLGRNITIQSNVTDPDNPGVTLALLVTIPGYQGTPRYYKLKTGIMNQHYRSDVNPTLPVISGDWDPEGWGYNWGTATRLFAKSYGLYAQRIDDRDVLTELVLPDGRSLKFKYNAFGEVAEVELPTGAKIQYDYGYTISMPSGNSPSWETGTDGAGNAIPTDVKWVDRTVQVKRTYADGVNLEGTWSFEYGSQTIGGVSYPCTTVAVNSNTAVLLTRQRHFFLPGGRYTEAYNTQSSHDGSHYNLWSTGLEWRTETLDAAGNVLAASEQDWTQRAPVSWSSYPQEQPAKDNRVNQTRRYLETGMMAKVETVYDQYNNPLEIKEYDYEQTLKRRTVTSYLSTNNGYNYQTDDSIHLLGLPETQTIYDGSGNQVAKTVTEYDVYANDNNRSVLTSYSSVSQHDSNYGTTKTTRGNPTRIGTWLNTTGSYIYSYPRFDILGNVVSAKDARGNVSTISFADDFGNGSTPGSPTQNPATPTYAFPTLITSPPPVPGAPVHTARSQYDYSTGLLTGFRDRNNVVTQTIYDDPFNRATLVKAALNIAGIESHAAMYYAPAMTPFGITLANNDVLMTKDQAAPDDAKLRSWTVTDGFGRSREAWTRDPQGDVKMITIYDALSRPKQVSNPFRPSLGETAVYTNTAYDPAGRVTSVTTPDGAVVTSAYSANTATVTDQASRKRKSVTDALGRLIEVYEDPTGSNYLTNYQYDTLDNLVAVAQGSQTRTFAYNSLKQLTAATNPESGTIGYQYDEAGNLLVKTDARGVSAHFSYDAFNRLTRRWYNGSNSVSAATHNSPALPAGVGASNEANFFYDVQSLPSGAPSFTRGAANGRLAAVTYGTNSSTGDYAGYDSAGRNILKIQQTGNVNYAMSVVLNVAGAPTLMVYPSGHTVTYEYDVAGRSSSLFGTLGDGTSRNYATELKYAAMGGLSKEKFGANSAVYHKLHYNVRGQLYDVRASNVDDEWGGELGALVNFYSNNWIHGGSGADNNGNVLMSQTLINSFYVEDRYSYDQLNRLTAVNEFQNGSTNTGSQQYEYDRWGNRTIKAASWGTGINNKQFTVNPGNNRLGVPAGQSGALTYDTAGNLTNDTYTGAGNRTYDAENKITSAWGGNNQAQLYGYDANGQRIKRTVDGVETWQVYGFGGELVAEYAASAAAAGPQKEYGYRNGQLLITAEPATAQQGTQNVTWTNTVGVSASGNNLTKTAADNWGNGGAASNQAIVSGDGYVQITASETNTFRMIGLSNGDANQNYTDIDFAAYLSGNNLCVYEAGINRGCLSTYANGDTIRVAVESGAVKYKKNGAVVYTSSVTPTYPLLTDSAFWSNSSTISNVVISGLLTGGVPQNTQNVSWSGPVGVSVSGNGLTKTAADNWGNSGAASSQAIVSGDGYVEITAAETNSFRMVGLSNGNANQDYTDIDFAAYLSGASLCIYESGINRGCVSTYTTGDAIRVAVESGVVKYRKNGALVYTSSITPSYPLLVDTALWSNGSTISNAVISGNLGAGGGVVRWLVADHLGTPRMIIDQTGTLANVKRHDYLPFGEELFAPSGGRSTALGYTSGDGLRQQFTAQERDIETGLDYFQARYYSFTQGRFTSPDEFSGGPEESFVRAGDSKKQALPYAEIAQPQSLNKYTYVYNNPCRFVDPDGHCGTPSGLKTGDVGICVASYIRSTFVPPSVPPGRGDGRGPNGQGGTSRIEVRVAVDLSKGTVTKTDETMGRSGAVFKNLGPKGEGGVQVSSPNKDEKGNLYFQISQHGKSKILEVAGSIDNHLNMVVTPDGKVGVTPSSTAKDYPSLEVYKYTVDAKGNVTTTLILDKKESGNLADLNRKEKPIQADPK